MELYVCVQVAKFIFPVDFMILDMEEDKEVMLILGRPFFGYKIIEFNLNGDKVVFDIDQALKYSSEKKACYKVDINDKCVHEFMKKKEESCTEVEFSSAIRQEGKDVQAKEATPATAELKKEISCADEEQDLDLLHELTEMVDNLYFDVEKAGKLETF